MSFSSNLLALIMACSGVALSLPAAAADWVIDYKKSNLTFTAMQGDIAIDGEFKKFDTAIDFNPAHPETGHIAVRIDMSSMTTGDQDRDSNLPTADWFNIGQFPDAQFISTAIHANSAIPGCYKADAELTIKGVSRNVTLPFCLIDEGDHKRAVGKLTLIRTDFNVGLGPWSGDAYIKQKVDVRVNLAATPAPEPADKPAAK